MAFEYPLPASTTALSPPRGLTARTFALWLLWLALASSAIVFFEPAPTDALMAGLVILLPLVGASSVNARLVVFIAAWLILGAAGLISSMQAGALDVAVKHIVISIFLSFAAVVISTAIANDPARNVRIVVSGLQFAVILSAVLGVLGYFHLVPGAYEFLTKFDRAKALFKDPNVYAAFLVPGFIYAVHCTASARATRVIPWAGIATLISLALLLSFSRGAILNAAISLLVYVLIAFSAARTNRFRLNLFVMVTLGAAAAAVGLLVLLQIDAVADLLSKRASVFMGYDSGPEGRFGGQLKAIGLIAEYPLGIGALEFSRAFHDEDVHNVYLSMFLNAGWLGGFTYFWLVLATLWTGLSLSIRSGPYQGIMLVFLASFAGMALEGAFVDTDHWRHFYILMGIIWGVAAAKDGNTGIARN